MINAFGICRHLATKHEAAISAAMIAANIKVKSGFGGGVTVARKKKLEEMWHHRAETLRGYLAINPGATGRDVKLGLDLSQSMHDAWMQRIRPNAKEYGIGVEKCNKTKKFYYWRLEDGPEQRNLI